ncbi:MAG: nucleotidyltransferase substrate binding protein [Coxiellaceae bacterium]|nr:MAG: nucleotidyltransferase substrate binding protein [Coxiellaceae bacterium]
MNSQSKLDFSSFQKAVISLDEALEAHRQDLNNRFIRDAAIQRFEYTYELASKMLRRYLLMAESSSQEVIEQSFPNLIRTGFERGLLLNSWDVWQKYRYARNITSHTYDEKSC